jgi:hypothetical protein
VRGGAWDQQSVWPIAWNKTESGKQVGNRSSPSSSVGEDVTRVCVGVNKKATVSGGLFFTPSPFSGRSGSAVVPIARILKFPQGGLRLSGATLAEEWGPTEP